MLSVAPWQRPLATPVYLANDLRKVIRHLVKYRGQVIRETVPACEMTLYLYSLLSPFYIAQRLGRQTWRRWMSSRSSRGRGVEPGAEARP